MKLQATVAAAILMFAPALHAFSIDFASSVGATLPPSLTINVPGYGDVQFDAGFNSITASQSVLEVGTLILGVPTLQFENGDSLIVTFLGEIPTDVDFDTLVISTLDNENFAAVAAGPKEYRVALQNSTDGAGIVQVHFNAIPEPASSLLGVMGLAGLIIRRRR